MTGIKRYKFPVIKKVSHGNITYNIGNTVNNTVTILCGDKWFLECGDHFAMYLTVRA